MLCSVYCTAVCRLVCKDLKVQTQRLQHIFRGGTYLSKPVPACLTEKPREGSTVWEMEGAGGPYHCGWGPPVATSGISW